MFGTDYYDSVLLGGKYQGEQIRKLEKLRKLPKKNIEYVGMPYLDRMKERADEGKNTHEDKNAVTVLLAPSWGESGILSRAVLVGIPAGVSRKLEHNDYISRKKTDPGKNNRRD